MFGSAQTTNPLATMRGLDWGKEARSGGTGVRRRKGRESKW